ncbi:helix-turn-helix domain-containing protein [Magnetospirillum gryphiswaldense]|uniref:helix-turn-helix transcriptional regulator n=1 Tax=Magnetospirillum gryphiswaldense TaxID=55518 RepID=UPI0030D8042A
MNQIELAARWNISHRTLERWRWTGEGPKFLKMGGRVVYRLEDIEAFEVERSRDSTTVRDDRRRDSDPHAGAGRAGLPRLDRPGRAR